MKCENCGKNEVTFVYQSNVNGKITEKHLCSECAEKLGYTRKVAAHSQRMMNDFFGSDPLGSGFFGGSLFDGLFSPVSMLGRMDRLMENPFDDFFSDMPALTAAPSQATEQQEKQQEKSGDNLVEKEEQSRFARMRELNALKMQMHKAVRQEEFEKAAELRDKIHALEKENQ